MATFTYEGKTSSGEVRKGNIDAADEKTARNQLKKMNINPTSIKKKSAGGFFQGKVTNKDLVLFTRQFATMIDSGLPLVQCLEIQSKQAENPVFRDELTVIKEKVESGSTFADALKSFPKTFDTLYQNMIAAGEVGGILDTILNRLAIYLEKNEKLKRQIKGAMSYPIITMVVAFVVVTILLVFVVPQFATMFADMGRELPAPTQFVIDLSEWLQANIVYLLVGIGGTIYGIRYSYKTDGGEVFWDKFLLRAPVIGNVVIKVSVARFCRTLGTMLSSGVAILEALDICGKTSGNRVIEDAVNFVRQGISEGRTVSDPLTETEVFPEMVCQMISVGEATGALDVMLNKVADFYEDEVDQAVENMTSLLEPMIMAFLGVVIGGLVIAMYLPIFTMAAGV
ncbi:MAG: pilus assembly protein PilC [Deltaproteobacteria bacterium]|nr:pilus assembly protein PilC [Deltaproteobacteria bacterium]